MPHNQKEDGIERIKNRQHGKNVQRSLNHKDNAQRLFLCNNKKRQGYGRYVKRNKGINKSKFINKNHEKGTMPKYRNWR